MLLVLCPKRYGQECQQIRSILAGLRRELRSQLSVAADGAFEEILRGCVNRKSKTGEVSRVPEISALNAYVEALGVSPNGMCWLDVTCSNSSRNSRRRIARSGSEHWVPQIRLVENACLSRDSNIYLHGGFADAINRIEDFYLPPQ